MKHKSRVRKQGQTRRSDKDGMPTMSYVRKTLKKTLIEIMASSKSTTDQKLEAAKIFVGVLEGE